MVPFLAVLSAKDLCPADRCNLAHPALLLRGGNSADSGTGSTYSCGASNLDGSLNDHRHSNLPADPDPSPYLHPHEHADSSTGTEYHLHLYAPFYSDTDRHPHAHRNPCGYQHPDYISHTHRFRDAFPHLDRHALTHIHPHTYSHSHTDPYANPYLDTNANPDAKPHCVHYPNGFHHNDRHSTTTMIPCLAISNKRIP